MSLGSFLFPWAQTGTVVSPRFVVPDYGRLVVFGSSYSDNGHPDDAPDQPGTGQADVRVWVDYLQDTLGIPQLNFAQGGATINSAIHACPVKDIYSQVNDYLTTWIPAAGQKKDIVAIFTTTNDITATWYNHRTTIMSTQGQAPEAALQEISRSAQSLVDQLTLLTDAKYASPDFLIFSIVPVELAPQSLIAQTQAGLSNSNAMRDITLKYNKVLEGGVQSIATALAGRGNVFSFDVHGWYLDMASTPEKYGLKVIDKACKPAGAPPCAEPDTHMWWDDLHLPAHLQRKVAAIAASLIQGAALPA